MSNRAIRSVRAPTEAEARSLSASVIAAFEAAGWALREALWVPADRRPSLGESILLDTDSQVLLDALGTFRLEFEHPDAAAIPPAVTTPERAPDAFESLGGVRYRRLVPRWGLGLVVLLVGLLVLFGLGSTMPGGGLFGAAPTPVNGLCPVGWVLGLQIDDDGALVPDGTCARLQ